MTGCGHQQPRNRIRIRRIDLCRGLAHHFTSIPVFPRRAGEVVADCRALLIVQLRFWAFQNPGGLAIGSKLTAVNLRAGSMSYKNDFAPHLAPRFDRAHWDAQRSVRMRLELSRSEG